MGAINNGVLASVWLLGSAAGWLQGVVVFEKPHGQGQREKEKQGRAVGGLLRREREREERAPAVSFVFHGP